MQDKAPYFWTVLNLLVINWPDRYFGSERSVWFVFYKHENFKINSENK